MIPCGPTTYVTQHKRNDWILCCVIIIIIIKIIILLVFLYNYGSIIYVSTACIYGLPENALLGNKNPKILYLHFQCVSFGSRAYSVHVL